MSALKNLDRPTHEYNDILINRVVSLLDSKTQRDWELNLTSSTECPMYFDLETFLLNRIRVLEAIPLSNSNVTSTPKPNLQSNVKFDMSKRTNINTHLALTKDDTFHFCQGSHFLYNCSSFKEKSVAERYNFAKINKLCTNCLRLQHKLNYCKSKFSCLQCKKGTLPCFTEKHPTTVILRLRSKLILRKKLQVFKSSIPC